MQVKVIGSDTPQFISGETDLRGVFVAEGLRGLVTAVARKANRQYAFYRGKTFVGQAAVPAGSRIKRQRTRRQCERRDHEPVARRQPQGAEHVE